MKTKYQDAHKFGDRWIASLNIKSYISTYKSVLVRQFCKLRVELRNANVIKSIVYTC